MPGRDLIDAHMAALRDNELLALLIFVMVKSPRHVSLGEKERYRASNYGRPFTVIGAFPTGQKLRRQAGRPSRDVSFRAGVREEPLLRFP